MSDAPAASPVAPEELLARMVFATRHFRPSDNTAKPEAFLPPPNLELSVSRHLDLSEQEIWQCGRDIAVQRGKPLYGRADVRALIPLANSLQVIPDPPPRNHALISGWPPDKSAQMSIAQEIAAASRFLRNPEQQNTVTF